MTLETPLPTITETNWRDYANCQDTYLELFFPETGETTRPAKRICAGCPDIVREHCLRWALEHDEQGVWGGTNEKDRRKMVRKGAA